MLLVAASSVVSGMAPGAVAAGASASQSLVALPDAAMQLTAYGGYVVFSQYDAQSDDWQLMDWHDGVVSTLPVAPRSVPFDVNAGSDASGQPVVVYSRCATEPSGAGQPLTNGVFLDWAHAAGCHIYELDLAGGQEQRVSAIGAPGASDSTPAIWHGEIAFARTYTSARRRIARIYLWRPGHGLERLQAGPGPCSPPLGCRHTKLSNPPNTTDTNDPRAYVSAMTLDRDVIGFEWTAIGPNVEDMGMVSELVVDQLDGGPQQVADSALYGGAGEYEAPGSPTAVGDSLLYLWQATLQGYSNNTRFVSFSPTTDSWSESKSSSGAQLAAVASDGQTTYSLDYTPNPLASGSGTFPGYQAGICSAQPVAGAGSSGGTCELTANTGLQLQREKRHLYEVCPGPVTVRPNGNGAIYCQSPLNARRTTHRR